MPELIHVNSDSKLNQLNDIHSKKAKLVKYYMDGCGHCISLEPVWNSVETKIQNLFPNDDSAIISLNEKFMHKSKLPKVTGFPTISFIKDNKKIDHEGERTEKAILDFYKKNIKSKSNQSGGNKLKRKSKRLRSKFKKKTTLKNNKKVMIVKDHEIKGWRQNTRNNNFKKILLKANRLGFKTIIVKDDEYADKKYNVKNQIKKLKTKKNIQYIH